MATLTFIAALLPLAIGTGAVYANPRRLVNQVFGLLSLCTALWLIFVFLARRDGILAETDPSVTPLPWVRAASAVAAFLPLIIWLMKESILAAAGQQLRHMRGALLWLFAGCCLAALCYTDSFVTVVTGAAKRPRGIAYVLYSSASLLLYLLLIVQTLRQWRAVTGIRRLEIQFLILNAGIAGVISIVLNGLGNAFDIRALPRLTPLVILVFYAFTAWAVTVHRVFDARQLFASLGQRVALIVFLGSGILALERLFASFIDTPFSLFLSVACVSPLAFFLERQTREWLHLSPKQRIARLRRAMTEAARSEASPDKLVTLFEELLRDWSQAGCARLLFDSGEVFVGGDIEFTKDRPAHPALVQSEWTTPESLQRRRAEPGLTDLRQFLTEFDLGLAVTAPRGSATPSLVLVLGTKVNQRPFTYPEVQQVQEIAEFMDNILARSRLTRQARQSEQLATIGLLGASLAHEIRNPLVSIKTFAHLLPTRFEDPEFRRRFHVLIPAEVDRIDSLTQQLLDLSNPRRHQMERISLHVVARETIDLMLTRATEARIHLVATYGATTDTIWADASAMRQVIINLLINAFQALDPQETDRRVELRTRSSPGGSVILEISDNGPGIPADQRARLFHPFVSTKTKGMGLGLAVCADILHEHKATIIVPDTGRPGATFRITFPCPPP